MVKPAARSAPATLAIAAGSAPKRSWNCAGVIQWRYWGLAGALLCGQQTVQRIAMGERQIDAEGQCLAQGDGFAEPCGARLGRQRQQRGARGQQQPPCTGGQCMFGHRSDPLFGRVRRGP